MAKKISTKKTPSFLMMEPQASTVTEFPEVTQFVVLRERDGLCYYRLMGKDGSTYDSFEPENNLDRGHCLEQAFGYTSLHKVYTYRVGGEPYPSRLIFQSRYLPTGPLTDTTTIPPGVQYTINWYQFRAIPPQYRDMHVGDANHVFLVSMKATWADLALVLMAFNNPRRYKLIVEGAPTTGKPVMKVIRQLG